MVNKLRVWWRHQHLYSRCWLWCRDCRWAQQSWAAGEFYSHDEPQWYMDELARRATPVSIVEPPTGPNITISANGVVTPAQTYAAGRVYVWLR